MTAATTATPGTRRRPVGARAASTGPILGLTVVGGALLVAGALLPWLSLYAGLDHLRGIDGTNGRILLGAGVLAAAAAPLYAAWPALWLRWGIGAIGFAASGFAAWDVSQLLGTYQQLHADPFTVASLGPGAFLALAGGLLILGTLLLPQAVGSTVASAAAASTSSSGDANDVLRAGVIVFLIGSAMIHLAVFGAHLQESTLYAAFFAFAGVAQAGLALLLAVRSRRPLLLAAVILNGLFIAVWAISRTTGLPFGPDPGVPESVTLPDVIATVEEGLVLGLALLLASRLRGALSMHRGIVRAGATALGVIALGATVLAVVAAQG